MHKKTVARQIIGVTMLVLIAGCTTEAAQRSRQKDIETCGGKPWSWCVGYHGGGR